MFSRKFISISLSLLFVLSLLSFSSCGGKNKGYSGSKVKSGSGMGNQRHKNKHVWGK